MLTEYARQALARTISKMHLAHDGTLPVVTLGHSVESAMAAAVQPTDQGSLFALDPNVAQTIVEKLAQLMEKSAARNYQSVVVCSAQIRGHFKKLVDRFIPNVTVLSYDEILANIDIQTFGTLELNNAN
jgi:flagellar biosynthesis protein FlhA